tara:strand:- start:796 stop:1695 length:900 start_codon:yes stop_codon:yes gene_type:complete
VPVYLDKIAFVHIPKCGGTSLTNALEEYVVEQQDGEGYDGEVRTWRKHESVTEINNWYTQRFGEEQTNSLIKFSVMRNPIYRAVSWLKYRQKTMKAITEMPGWFDGVHPEKGRYCWDPLGSAAAAVTTEQFNQSLAKYGKACASAQLGTAEERIEPQKRDNCYHWTTPEEVDKFLSLNFHDWINEATVHGQTGCEHSDCPYHLLEPQVSWITDESGELAVDALFRIEKAEEITEFLPGLQIGRENVGTSSIADYHNELTKDSLRVVLDYYAKDLELYSLLKKEQENDNDVDRNSAKPAG